MLSQLWFARPRFPLSTSPFLATFNTHLVPSCFREDGEYRFKCVSLTSSESISARPWHLPRLVCRLFRDVSRTRRARSSFKKVATKRVTPEKMCVFFQHRTRNYITCITYVLPDIRFLWHANQCRHATSQYAIHFQR